MTPTLPRLLGAQACLCPDWETTDDQTGHEACNSGAGAVHLQASITIQLFFAMKRMKSFLQFAALLGLVALLPATSRGTNTEPFQFCTGVERTCSFFNAGYGTIRVYMPPCIPLLVLGYGTK